MPHRDSPWPAGTPCWVDLAVPDLPAAVAFYREVIGWEFVDSGAEFGHFHVARTNGRAAAGIGPVMSEDQPAAWTVYLAVDDVDATVGALTEHGGTVLAGPMDIPGNGKMAVAADPTGAVFGVWQATGQIGVEIYNEAGSLVWEDARLLDPEAGRTFYAAVFGFDYQPVPGAPEDYTTFGVGAEPAGGIGGMMGAPAGTPGHWLPYFGVPDADAAVEAAAGGGGTVLSGPTTSPFGRMGFLADPFGAVFAVHQPVSE